MRWEDERYVRVYTRDTGDWLALSFEAQAVFLMLLRKVDRIGELHLGKRGRAAIPACIGHGGRPIDAAIEELLADGCIRLDEKSGRLFIPNFLLAQEVAKSPADRKREQRERDAAQITERTKLSRDVTDVTNGHEMSRSAVPNHAVPSRAVPPPRDAVPAKPVPTPVGEFRDRIDAEFKKQRDARYDWTTLDENAVTNLLGKTGGEEEIHRRWAIALRKPFPQCNTVADLLKHWNACAKDTASTGPPLRPKDITRGTVTAESQKHLHAAKAGEEHPF